jgi:hypothetical protein
VGATGVLALSLAVSLAISLVGWLALGIGAVLVICIFVAIAFYPRDNSF